MSFKAFFEKKQQTPDTEARAQARAAMQQQASLDWAYRMSASVVTRFSVETLVPFGRDVPQSAEKWEPALRLLPDCLQHPSDGATLWSLNHTTRKAALSRLKTVDNIRAALDLHPSRPQDVVQQLSFLLQDPNLGTGPHCAMGFWIPPCLFVFPPASPAVLCQGTSMLCSHLCRLSVHVNSHM